MVNTCTTTSCGTVPLFRAVNTRPRSASIISRRRRA
jgi:hypothetical protein